MMRAEQAIEGRMYHLNKKGNQPEEKSAECYGWNHNKEFVRFLVFDEYGSRKIRMVFPQEEIDSL